MNLAIVILAAGQGKRMCSRLPKVLHPLGGKSLLEHVVNTAQLLKHASIMVVHGHEGEQVQKQLSHLSVQWVLQQERLGTGHALAQALPLIADDVTVLVLLGDTPLISPLTLQKLIQKTPSNTLGMITATVDDPSGLGRIVRDDRGNVERVIEEKEATPDQRSIKEIYTGIMLAPATSFKKWIPQLNNHNAQEEYYLTDIVAMASQTESIIVAIPAESIEEVQGINDRVQLASLERYYQFQIAKRLMLQGVTLMDPKRLDIRGTLDVAQDVVIDVNVVIEGRVVIGSNCHIGSNVLLRNVTIADHVTIQSHSVIEGAEINEHCTVGPFARIRPGTTLASGVHVGNFSEIKNTQIGIGSKVNHVSYLGDTTIGEKVNIGAGTITCNYDGVHKHRTQIGDGAFIGSNSSLVPPVVIGAGATVGAGSTITEDVPPQKLAIARTRQSIIEGWQRSNKKGDKT